jgi:hypothetical protein
MALNRGKCLIESADSVVEINELLQTDSIESASV